ncbi:MAG: hypothetical protein P8Y97_23180 [Candidatus Lokiarchaeota archaeon]
MTDSNYFIFIINPKAWEIIKKEELIGTYRKDIYDKIRRKDKILIYVTEISEIDALYEVEDKIKLDKKVPKLNSPYLLKISLIKYFEKKPDFKKIIQKLDFIKNKEKWYSHLAGVKGIKELSLKDFTAIIKFLQ